MLAPGYHAVKEFGEIKFSNDISAVHNIRLGDFVYGANELALDVPAVSSGVLRIDTQVSYEGHVAEHATSVHEVGGGGGDLEHAYQINQSGQLAFGFTVVDAHTLQPYYISPLYHQANVAGALLELCKMEGEGDSRVYVNGRELGREGVRLLRGENIIAVETNAPTRASFSYEGVVIDTSGAWYSAENPGPEWNQKISLNENWQVDEAADGWIGKEGQARYYARTLLLEHSDIWPQWGEEGVWLAEGAAQRIHVLPRGLEGHELEAYTISVMVPKGLRFHGASGYLSRYPLSHRYDGTSVVHGLEYSRYVVVFKEPLRYQEEHRQERHLVSLVVEAEEGMAGQAPVDMLYAVSAEGGAYHEVFNTLRVNVLPPLNGRQPGEHLWQMWTHALTAMDDHHLRQRLLEVLANAGFNDVRLTSCIFGADVESFRDREAFAKAVRLPADAPLRPMALLRHGWQHVDVSSYTAEHRDHMLIDRNGSAFSNLICPTILLHDEQARNVYRQELAKWIEAKQISHVNWDYEFSVWGHSAATCYCGRCMDAFRAEAGIASDEPLDQERLREMYSEAWVGFVNRRVGEYASMLYDAIKAINPDIVFSVYSGYQSEETKERYGIDWKYIAGRADYAMAGYGRPLGALNDTLDALGETRFVPGAIVRPFSVTNRATPEPVSKARLARRLFDGTGGILIYQDGSVDGRTLHASAELSRLVADYESLFVNRRVDASGIKVEGLPDDHAIVLAGEGKRLIAIINDTGAAAAVTVTLDESMQSWHVYDYYAEKEYGQVGAIEMEVAAQDVHVYVLEY